MKVTELFESLDNFEEILMLMKHGKLSRERAEELAKTLKEFKFLVSNRLVPANLRWVQDKKTGVLKFVAADMPGSWRSGPAAASRHKVVTLLNDFGFIVTRFPSMAAERKAMTSNGPHIYFWGPGTLPPQEDST